MAVPSKLHIKNILITKARLIGNSDRGFKELCSDLINQQGTDQATFEKIAENCFVSVSTVRRMATLKETETGEEYNPSEDTLKRFFRYYGVEFHGDQVVISKPWQNKPKKE